MPNKLLGVHTRQPKILLPNSTCFLFFVLLKCAWLLLCRERNVYVCPIVPSSQCVRPLVITGRSLLPSATHTLPHTGDHIAQSLLSCQVVAKQSRCQPVSPWMRPSTTSKTLSLPWTSLNLVIMPFTFHVWWNLTEIQKWHKNCLFNQDRVFLKIFNG